MIYVGIDDTDILGSRGTNQLAKAIVRAAVGWRCHGIVRHQLLDDPRIPYTSKNGSASILLERRCGDAAKDPSCISRVTEICLQMMREWFIVGSDPGLCVTDHVPDEVTQFGWRCKQEIVTQADARGLASKHGIYLQGLGGTEGGVIGALAAIGLIVTGNDGRVVQHGEWPDDLSGPQSVSVLKARGIVVENIDTSTVVDTGLVDVGKHMRPNWREGRIKLFVRCPQPELEADYYQAIRLT